MRDRTILNFNQESFTLPKVINTIGALKSGGINVKALVIDGLDLDKISKKYKITSEKLAVYNNIEDARKLFPGMVLRIPL